MMKKTSLVALGAATLLALAGCSISGGGTTPTTAPTGGGETTAPPVDTSPLNVGVLLPLTGPYSILGLPQQAALELEAEKINSEGGVAGRDIVLEIRDDTGDPTTSVQLYNELAETGDYDLMITSSRTAASQATGPSAEQYEIPTLALGPVNAFTDGSNPWVFVIPATGAVNAEAQIQYFAAEGYDKVAIAYIDGDAYGQDGQDSLERFGPEYGIETVLSQGYDPATTDFAPLIANVLASGANAFWIWGSGPTPAIITGQWAATPDKGDVQLFMTGSQASNLYSYREGAPVAAANGVILASNIAVPGKQLPPSDLKTIVDDFAGRWAGLNDPQFQYPPQFAFEAATSLQILDAAVESLGGATDDAAAVRDAVEATDMITYVGQRTYSPTDHGGVTPDWLAIVEVEDGDFIATDYALAKFEEILG
jgi:branched-chain amino acid transport system substrate-binding protein